MNGLKNCPFCGSYYTDASWITTSDHSDGASANCLKCGASIYDSTKEWVVETWNSRIESQDANSCPFCGSLKIKHNVFPKSCTIECEECGASTGFATTLEEATKMWQKRTRPVSCSFCDDTGFIYTNIDDTNECKYHKTLCPHCGKR